MTAACTVYVTVGSRDEALRIARTVVGERLAACANLLSDITSVYRWEGKVEEAGEVALLLKTRAALYPQLEARLRTLHSYAVPCIVAWPIENGAEDFLGWIATETLDPLSEV